MLLSFQSGCRTILDSSLYVKSPRLIHTRKDTEASKKDPGQNVETAEPKTVDRPSRVLVEFNFGLILRA